MSAAETTEMQQAKTRELVALAFFIALSVLAVRDFDPFPPLSDQGRAMLGPPPSQEMMSMALIVYSFAAIIRILSRIMNGDLTSGGLSHAGYLAAFYLFFHLSGLLRENFWAVFAAGCTIFALESYQIWSLSQAEQPR